MYLHMNFGKSLCGKYLKFLSVASMIVAILGVGVFGNSMIVLSEETSTLEKLKKEAINFHEVAPGIYRSGLLSERAPQLLKELGIKTVVNFDDHRKRARKEEERLSELGIQAVSLPWSGWDYPEDETLAEVMTLMESPEHKPILVHCKHGQERTGVAIACWRIAHDGWSADQAYQEMKSYGFRPFQYGHLKRYVYEFARAHGDQKAETKNQIEQIKTNIFYFFYQLRKANFFKDAA